MVLMLLCVSRLFAADTVLFTNGDRITGKLVRADSSQITFDSPMLGTVKIPWSKIQSLQTDEKFVILGKKQAATQGRLNTDAKQIRVISDPGSEPASIAIAQTNLIVPPDVYAKDIAETPRPWQNWKGSIAGGLNLVNATQSSQSYTASIHLDRPVPQLDWLPEQSDTQIAFEGNYGKVSQPGEPTLRTNILNLALEQDQYLHDGLFTFGTAQFNHNVAQGLQLQQAYGGGIGWKRVRGDASEFDLKADLHFTRQVFLDAPNQHFLASSYTEAWTRKFSGAIVWNESISAVPSYTNGLAYQLNGMTSLVIPVYKQLSLNTTLIDSYLGNPQPGYLHNSLQFSSGIQFNFQP
jgi:hypothetical protein